MKLTLYFNERERVYEVLEQLGLECSTPRMRERLSEEAMSKILELMLALRGSV